jgi:peptidoglycan/LPS O-acetylase OafA/YrhL
MDGVGIFFVLSGFLIGNILLRHFTKEGFSTGSVFDFWIRRWLRTLPNYLLILCLLLMIKKLVIPEFAPKAYLNFFIFSQNLFKPHPYDFFPEAWSLSIEEWFYLLLPVLLFVGFVFGKMPFKKAIIFSTVVILLFSFGMRLFRFINIETISATIVDSHFRKQVCTRLDSIMIGVIGAYFSYYHSALWLQRKRLLLFIGLLIMFFSKVLNEYFQLPFFNSVLFFTLNPIGILMVFPFISQIQSGSGFLYKFITVTSLVSYSLYLVNNSLVLGYIQPFISEMLTAQLTNIESKPLLSLVNSIIFLLITFGLSYFLYRYFETPVMNLRELIKRKPGKSEK